LTQNVIIELHKPRVGYPLLTPANVSYCKSRLTALRSSFASYIIRN